MKSYSIIELSLPVALWIGILLHLLAARLYIPSSYSSSRPLWAKIHFLICSLSLLALPFHFLTPSPIIQLANAVLMTILLAIVAFAAAGRTSLHGLQRIDELFMDIALLHFCGGTIWLCAAVLQLQFLGFHWPWTGLTAIHFIYAAHLLPLLMAAALRQVPLNFKFYRRLGGMALTIYYIGFWMIAATINSGEFYAVGAIFLLLLAIFLWSIAVWIGSQKSRFILLMLCGIFLTTLYPAVQFSIGSITSIEQMILYHGAPNILFLLPIAFLCAGISRPNMAAHDMPLSRAISEYSVKNWVEGFKVSDTAWKGFVKDFSVFESSEFEVSGIAPEIREFYENTLDFSIDVKACWRQPFATLWKFALPKFTKWGQFALTVNQERLESKISSVALPRDPREDVRTWFRWEKESMRSMYVATYSTHKDNRRVYMNIAFPLPFGTVSSILRLTAVNYSTIELTSMAHPKNSGDEGVYFTAGLLRVKLPLNETISVQSSEIGSDLTANHFVWIFGLRFLTLSYKLQKIPDDGQAEKGV